jgi:hypothetical protein
MRRNVASCPAATHRCSGLIRLVTGEQWSRILLSTEARERKGLTVEFGFGLSGDECQFF